MRFVTAATVARLANEMFPVAGVLLILERSEKPWLAGACVAAMTLPSLVAGPLLGATLDRAARPARLLALDQIVAAVSLLALLVVIGSSPAAVALALSTAAGATFALSAGGFSALIPSFVPERLRRPANAVDAATYNLALIAGPALAGGLAFALGPVAALGTEVALKLVACGLCLGLGAPGRAQAVSGSVRAHVATGMRHVLQTRALLAVTVASALGLAGRGLLVVVFPLFAVSNLDAERATAAALWTALAAGLIAGSLGFAAYGQSRGEIVLIGSLGLGGMAMALLPLASSVPLAALLVLAAGLMLGPGLPATLTARQEHTPPNLHGQVMLTGASIKIAAFGLGAAAGGAVVDVTAVTTALLLAAGLHLAGAMAALVLLVVVDQDLVDEVKPNSDAKHAAQERLVRSSLEEGVD